MQLNPQLCNKAKMTKLPLNSQIITLKIFKKIIQNP